MPHPSTADCLIPILRSRGTDEKAETDAGQGWLNRKSKIQNRELELGVERLRFHFHEKDTKSWRLP